MNRTIFAALLVGLLMPGSASALARAIFPDSAKLQPPPTYSHPNVSGNVNTTLEPSAYVPDTPYESEGQNNDEINKPTARAAEQTKPGFDFVLWGSMGALVLSGIVYIVIRLRMSDDVVNT